MISWINILQSACTKYLFVIVHVFLLSMSKFSMHCNAYDSWIWNCWSLGGSTDLEHALQIFLTFHDCAFVSRNSTMHPNLVWLSFQSTMPWNKQWNILFSTCVSFWNSTDWLKSYKTCTFAFILFSFLSHTITLPFSECWAHGTTHDI